MTSHATPHPLLPHATDERLAAVAHALADASGAAPSGPDLVGLVDLRSIGIEPAADEPPDRIVVVPLDDPDPGIALLGLTAPPEVWAVGVATSARARSLDGARRMPDTTFVHLVDRLGRSVSILRPAGREPLVDGPGPDVIEGRVADACRRMLGLTTAPPPADMTAHVVDMWLARVTRDALDQPGLGWAEVVARHPATEPTSPCTTSPTPAALARRTTDFGAELDWDRYRLRCAEAGSTPFGEVDGDVAAWMDAGMFARWMLGEAIPWPDHLGLLDALLSPVAAERVRLTVDLCPPAPWPPR